MYQFDKANREMSERNLSVKQSRLAIRASIVAFARDKKSGAMQLDSSSSKRHSDRRSVRFSDMVSEIGGPSRMKDSASRLRLCEDDSLGASAELTSGEMTSNEQAIDLYSDSEEDQPDQSQPCHSMNTAGDTLGTPDISIRDLKKGKSDSDIVMSRDLYNGNSGNDVMPAEGLGGTAISDIAGEMEGSVSAQDAALEKPDLARHRSQSAPSLTVLTGRTESGHRVGPDLPGYRFQEVLQATFGDRAAITAEARLVEAEDEDDAENSVTSSPP